MLPAWSKTISPGPPPSAPPVKRYRTVTFQGQTKLLQKDAGGAVAVRPITVLRSSGEGVKDALRPPARRGGELEHRSAKVATASGLAAQLGWTVDAARLVENDLPRAAAISAPGKAVQDGYIPGADEALAERCRGRRCRQANNRPAILRRRCKGRSPSTRPQRG